EGRSRHRAGTPDRTQRRAARLRGALHQPQRPAEAAPLPARPSYAPRSGRQWSGSVRPAGAARPVLAELLTFNVLRRPMARPPRVIIAPASPKGGSFLLRSRTVTSDRFVT